MNVRVVFKEESDHARPVLDFLRDFEHQTGRQLETVDPESRDGEALCRVYDIVQYPTIFAVSDDGKLQNSWQGLPLPTISEVGFYA